MKITTVVGVMVLAVVALSSCVSDMFGVTGEGEIVSEARSARDFQTIVLTTNADVVIKRDTGYRVEVEDYQNLINYTRVKVSSHKLLVDINPASSILKNSVAKIRIWMPDTLSTLVLTASGSVDMDTSFKDLTGVKVTGSGSVRMNQPLKLGVLTNEVLGSGSITGSGSVKTLNCTVAGSGNLHFDSMVASKALCYISGSGNATVRPDTLVAALSGSGNVYYYGTPVIASKITGSGTLISK